MSSEISRVEVFVEDKNLGRVLRAVTGLAIRPPDIRPVVNAQVSNGKMSQVTNGQLVQLFIDDLKKKGIKETNAPNMRAFLVGIGKSPTSYSYLLTTALKYGVIKKKRGTSGKQTAYVVLPGKKVK